MAASAGPGSAAGGRDQRAWDLVVQGPDWQIGVEAETRLSDIQALLRRVHLKQRVVVRRELASGNPRSV